MSFRAESILLAVIKCNRCLKWMDQMVGKRILSYISHRINIPPVRCVANAFKSCQSLALSAWCHKADRITPLPREETSQAGLPLGGKTLQKITKN